MIIGLIGFVSSGKGTISDILCDDHGFVKDSFAATLKDAVSSVFGWERQLLEGDTEESRIFRETIDPFWTRKLGYNFSPRIAFQKFGTEAIRNNIHPDLWVFTLERRLLQNKTENINTVINDVRFPNECDFVRSQGGVLIRVKREEDPIWFDTAKRANRNNDPYMMSPFDIHYSEWAWIGQKVSFVIENYSDVDNLKSQLDYILSYLNGHAIVSN